MKKIEDLSAEQLAVIKEKLSNMAYEYEMRVMDYIMPFFVEESDEDDEDFCDEELFIFYDLWEKLKD
ncbi:MAG: hypothetical protein J1E77_03075 [Prevotella sp.]|nr:hypothetical protein [Prevotella sp.]